MKEIPCLRVSSGIENQIITLQNLCGVIMNAKSGYMKSLAKSILIEMSQKGIFSIKTTTKQMKIR